jgi:hypothetical protein
MATTTTTTVRTIEEALRIDAFDTRPEVADRCVRALLSERWPCAVERPELVVEPAAGAGVFVQALRAALGPRPQIAAIDKYREEKGLVAGGIDFLEWPAPSASSVGVWVVGNPPFGSNASLVVEFFNRAAEFAELIAFIVPKCFRNVSSTRLDERFTLRHESRLPADAFLVGSTPYRVHTYWQVWTRRRADEPRVTRLARVTVPPGIEKRVRAMTAVEMEPVMALMMLGELRAAEAAFRSMCGLVVARVHAQAGHVADSYERVVGALSEVKRRGASFVAEAWFFFRTVGATRDADRAALVEAFRPITLTGLGSRGNVTHDECMAQFGDVLIVQ